MLNFLVGWVFGLILPLVAAAAAGFVLAPVVGYEIAVAASIIAGAIILAIHFSTYTFQKE